jgi:hypothetical protein
VFDWTIKVTPDYSLLVSGHLYDVLYHGISYIGFFKETDNNKACFFCFDLEANGGEFYFPVEEFTAVEHPDNHLATIADAVMHDREMPWLAEMVRFGDGGFLPRLSK